MGLLYRSTHRKYIYLPPSIILLCTNCEIHNLYTQKWWRQIFHKKLRSWGTGWRDHWGYQLHTSDRRWRNTSERWSRGWEGRTHLDCVERNIMWQTCDQDVPLQSHLQTPPFTLAGNFWSDFWYSCHNTWSIVLVTNQPPRLAHVPCSPCQLLDWKLHPGYMHEAIWPSSTG